MIHWHYITANENGIRFSTAIPARTWEGARRAFAAGRVYRNVKR